MSSPPAFPDALVTTKDIFHCCHKAVSVSRLIGGRIAIRRSPVKPAATAVSTDAILGNILAYKVARFCQDLNRGNIWQPTVKNTLCLVK